MEYLNQGPASPLASTPVQDTHLTWIQGFIFGFSFFTMWFRVINPELNVLGGIQKSWEILRDKRKRPSRWLMVKSHLSAAIATLYDRGWTLSSAWLWVDPEGLEFPVKPLSWDQQ
eukprot:4000391-Pyramimonas_sp.AAC.1